MANDIDVKKIITIFSYTLGGIVLSWVLKLQKIIAFSTIEVEYSLVIKASKEMVCNLFLEELGHKYKKRCIIL